jgi:hypothetical protein
MKTTIDPSSEGQLAAGQTIEPGDEVEFSGFRYKKNFKTIQGKIIKFYGRPCKPIFAFVKNVKGEIMVQNLEDLVNNLILFFCSILREI